MTLRVIKHNDKTSIVTAWSRQRGRISFAIPAGASKHATAIRASMMPFSIFEGTANIRAGAEIAKISDVRPLSGIHAVAADPIRQIIAMFLADFLYAVLRESQPDDNLTDYVFEAAQRLSNAKKTALANFHLHFIYRLGQYLGIAPDTGTYARGRYFDLREGIFTSTAPLHKYYIEPDGAKLVMLLSTLNYENLGLLKINREARNRILDSMIDYYSLHHTPLSMLTSLSIIRSLFD